MRTDPAGEIDVEGSEFRVLKGFSGRLSAQKIHCVQFEYGAFATQARFLLGDQYSMLAESYWIGKIFPRYVNFRDYDWTMEDFRARSKKESGNIVKAAKLLA